MMTLLQALSVSVEALPLYYVSLGSLGGDLSLTDHETSIRI